MPRSCLRSNDTLASLPLRACNMYNVGGCKLLLTSWGGGGGRVRWGSSLNPHNDLFTEIKTDKKQGGVERGWYRTFKQHQVSPCTVTPPPLPVPWGHLILLYPICQHHCPHISFQPPKYWVSAWLIEGNSPQENLRKIELEGECCGWNMFAFIPRGDYRLQPSPIYFLAQCVLA